MMIGEIGGRSERRGNERHNRGRVGEKDEERDGRQREGCEKMNRRWLMHGNK